MSPDRISSPSPFAETLRALARERAEKTGRSKKAATSPDSDNPLKVESRPAIGQLRERLSSLTQSIDVNDHRSVNAIRDSALREILLWEFGSDFRNDPQFLPMLEAIGNAMDTDAEYRKGFADLLVDLKKG